MDDLDNFDRQILDLLKIDSRRTGEQLSDLIGLSPAACLRRVQRLRKDRVIEREVAILSPEYEKRGTTILMLLRINGQNPRVMDDFCHRLKRQEEVQRLMWVTGDDDIALILKCPTMEDFADFCQAHLNVEPVEGYKTLVSMREYQAGDT